MPPGAPTPACLTVKPGRKRTIASAITYRAISTILLGVISWVVTGEWVESLAVTLTFAFLATVLYYFNDRAWERTDWGRKAEGPIETSGPVTHRTKPRLTPHVATELIPLWRDLLEEAS